MRRRIAAVLLVVLAFLLSACQATAPAAPFAGTEIRGLYRLPGTRLTDTAGEPRALAPAKPLTVVFFGYSACPDVCTGVVADVAAARARLAERDRGDVDVVVVSTDPARDTPEVLGAWLDRIDPAVVGLTGPLADVVAAGNAVGVHIEKGRSLPSGGYEVDHGTQVLVFGPDGGSLLVWTSGRSIGEMRGDLEKLLKEVR